MKYRILGLITALTMSVSFTGCATMDQSLELGGGMGAAVGATATYGAYSASGESPSIGTVAIGAAVGAALGLITSYFTHKNVAEDRRGYEADQIEMHFGDMPPSPFIVPKTQIKKGAK